MFVVMAAGDFNVYVGAGMRGLLARRGRCIYGMFWGIPRLPNLFLSLFDDIRRCKLDDSVKGILDSVMESWLTIYPCPPHYGLNGMPH